MWCCRIKSHTLLPWSLVKETHQHFHSTCAQWERRFGDNFFLFKSCPLLLMFSDQIVDSKKISAETGHLDLCSCGAAIEFTRSKNCVLQALS